MELAAISFPIFGDDLFINIPNYITVFGIPIYLYGILIALGFMLAALYVLKRRNAFGLSQDNVLDMVIVAIPSALIGARLYYVIFNPSDYFGAGKWLNIFKIREGGLAVYGGIICAAAAIIIYSRVKKVPFGRFADAGAMGLLVGQAIGRWGNFFNREAFGSETSVPWRMGLTTSSGTIYVHPAFLYESLWNAAGFVLLHIFSKKRKKYDGQLFLLYLLWYGLGRYMIEGLRVDSLYLFNSDIRVSQLLAALSFCTAAVILVRNHMRGIRSSRFEVSPVEVVEKNALLSDSVEDVSESESEDIEYNNINTETHEAGGGKTTGADSGN